MHFNVPHQRGITKRFYVLATQMPIVLRGHDAGQWLKHGPRAKRHRLSNHSLSSLRYNWKHFPTSKFSHKRPARCSFQWVFLPTVPYVLPVVQMSLMSSVYSTVIISMERYVRICRVRPLPDKVGGRKKIEGKSFLIKELVTFGGIAVREKLPPLRGRLSGPVLPAQVLRVQVHQDRPDGHPGYQLHRVGELCGLFLFWVPASTVHSFFRTTIHCYPRGTPSQSTWTGPPSTSATRPRPSAPRWSTAKMPSPPPATPRPATLPRISSNQSR